MPQPGLSRRRLGGPCRLPRLRDGLPARQRRRRDRHADRLLSIPSATEPELALGRLDPLLLLPPLRGPPPRPLPQPVPGKARPRSGLGERIDLGAKGRRRLPYLLPNRIPLQSLL